MHIHSQPTMVAPIGPSTYFFLSFTKRKLRIRVWYGIRSGKCSQLGILLIFDDNPVRVLTLILPPRKFKGDFPAAELGLRRLGNAVPT
jgi:hypothetical protein